MKKSKLEKVLDDTNLLKGVKSHDAGMMIYKGGIALDYLILSYKDHHVVYLHDNAKDILAKGKAYNLEDAKDLAVEKIEEKLNRNYR